MNKIKLYNRDGANMWLEKTKDLGNNLSEWKLKVDNKHQYCLEYIRCIGNYPEIDAIDPSGGPFISVADEFEGKYKIVKINSCKSIYISENGNNK